MESKTEKLNVLFQDWEYDIPEYQGHFVRDGIIQEELFNETSPKILFITKEPNNPKQEAGDFRDWWKDELKYTFSLRISEWAFGIQNEFPNYDKIKKSKEAKLESIHRIAFLNVKKSGGSGNAKPDEIGRHIDMNLKFIHTEIEIIEPDIIILGISTIQLRTQLFPELEGNWVESGYDIAIARFKKAKVIDFYHPSSRTAPAASYGLLQNIIRSPAFKKL